MSYPRYKDGTPCLDAIYDEETGQSVCIYTGEALRRSTAEEDAAELAIVRARVAAGPKDLDLIFDEDEGGMVSLYGQTGN